MTTPVLKGKFLTGRFALHGPPRCCAQGIYAEAVLVDQLLRRAGFAKAVLHADTLDRYADALRKRLAYRAAQPTDDLMLLAGNNSAGFRGVPDDVLTVKRLDGMHVDDAGRNAFAESCSAARIA